MSRRAETARPFRHAVTQRHHPHPRLLAQQALPAWGRGGAWLERYGEDRTTLLLFGAGHVGRALVLALAPLPFAILWIDGRDEAFPPHIPANVAPTRIADPTTALDRARPGSFVLVMTHDHALDLAITAAALQRPDLPFVGLIGSATKRARFEKRLREAGMPEQRVADLVCPIGIPGIRGKEPAVIAASAAAQLLQAREAVGGGCTVRPAADARQTGRMVEPLGESS